MFLLCLLSFFFLGLICSVSLLSLFFYLYLSFSQKADALKIWTFGCPPDGRANVLVDVTKACAYLLEIKDSMCAAFAQITSGGCFAEEPWRGVRVNLQDVVLHSDSIHRGAGQIQPAAKRVYSAVQIKSGPRLMEPMVCALAFEEDESR